MQILSWIYLKFTIDTPMISDFCIFIIDFEHMEFNMEHMEFKLIFYIYSFEQVICFVISVYF